MDFMSLEHKIHIFSPPCNILIYYMDSGILLGTKTLVELIRHYIRDTVRVFSVCHA